MDSPNQVNQTNPAVVAEQSRIPNGRGDNSVQHTSRLQNLPLMLNYFDGQNPQECENFMVQFEAVAQMGNWTDAEQGLILKSRLRGQALTFITNDPSLRNETSFKVIKLKLMNFFAEQPSLATNHMRFSTIKQQPGESIKNLVFRIDNAAMQYLSDGDIATSNSNPMINTIKLSKFLEALNHDLRLDVLKMNPKNYSDAIEKAKCVENAQQLVAADLLKASVNHFTDNNVEEKMNTLMQTHKENVEKIAALTAEINAMRLQNSDKTITNTPQRTHSSGAQRRNNMQEMPNDLSCAFCGYNNHIMRNCRFFKQATGNNEIRQQYNYREQNFENNLPSRFSHQNRDRPRETQQYRGRNVMRQENSHNYRRDNPDRLQSARNSVHTEVQRGRRQNHYLN